jgi:hypothetical protein
MADLFLMQRSTIQKLKLDVHVAQILERVAIRKKSLESLLSEELEVDSKKMNIGNRPGAYELESELERRLSEIEKERRMEDVGCFRDLTHVMRDFLSVLEALEAAKARERILMPGNELDFKYQRSGSDQ